MYTEYMHPREVGFAFLCVSAAFTKSPYMLNHKASLKKWFYNWKQTHRILWPWQSWARSQYEHENDKMEIISKYQKKQHIS